MNIVDCEQGTPEWHAARCGKVTASRIPDVLAKGKSGAPSMSRTNYIAELVTERLTGAAAERFGGSGPMEWGKQHEDAAADMYAFMRDVEVLKVGFVLHPTVELSGASPDRLVGDDGLIQIKCPNTATHLETLLNDDVDTKYVKQMQWEMACTNRLWCDFVSYDPRMPAHLQLAVIRFHRDSSAIIGMQAEVAAVLTEVDQTLSRLKAKFQPLTEAAE